MEKWRATVYKDTGRICDGGYREADTFTVTEDVELIELSAASAIPPELAKWDGQKIVATSAKDAQEDMEWRGLAKILYKYRARIKEWLRE